MNGSATIARSMLVAVLLSGTVEPCSRNEIRLIWSKSRHSSHALFRFLEGDKVGFIDRSGNIVIPSRFDSTGNRTGDFVEGLARVRVGRRWGFIDPNGEFVIEPRFLVAQDFSEGLAEVSIPGDAFLTHYIDRTGAIVLSGRFQGSRFSQGLASIRLHGENWHPGKEGYIDKLGRIVIKPQFAVAGRFSEGLAHVALDGECWITSNMGRMPSPSVPMETSCGGVAKEITEPCLHGFIDQSGELRIEAQFTNAGNFLEGYAPVEMDGKWGYIDRTGQFVIKPRFDEALSFDQGRAAVLVDDLWGYIDKAGNWVVPPLYKSAASFSQGLALARDDSGSVYVDRTGREVFRHNGWLATSFVKGLAHIRLSADRFAYIDRTGGVVFAYEADDYMTEVEPGNAQADRKPLRD